MEIKLSEIEQKYIRSMVETGFYPDESAVLADAIRKMREEYNVKREKLTAALALGQKDIAEGRSVEYTPDLLGECATRAARNLKDGKTPNPDVCS